jgi:hypothetical protein
MARSASGACLWVARLVCSHQLQALTVFRLKHGNILFEFGSALICGFYSETPMTERKQFAI